MTKVDISHNTLVSNLVLLEDFVQDFPLDIAMRLSGRLFLENMQAIIKCNTGTDKPEEKLELITDFVLRLDLWSEEAVKLKILDHKKPSLAPVLEAVKNSAAPVCEATDLFAVLESAATDPDAEAKKPPAKKAKKMTALEACHVCKMLKFECVR